jgi:hypothetical protein
LNQYQLFLAFVLVGFLSEPIHFDEALHNFHLEVFGAVNVVLLLSRWHPWPLASGYLAGVIGGAAVA